MSAFLVMSQPTLKTEELRSLMEQKVAAGDGPGQTPSCDGQRQKEEVFCTG